MRTALRNRIRQELRNHARRGHDATLDSKVPDEGPSPLMTTVTQESLERYERALEQLPEAQRQAIVARASNQGTQNFVRLAWDPDRAEAGDSGDGWVKVQAYDGATWDYLGVDFSQFGATTDGYFLNGTTWPSG